MTLRRIGAFWLALGLVACGSAQSEYKAAFAQADQARGQGNLLHARDEYEAAARLATTDEDCAEAYYRAAHVRVPGEPSLARVTRLDALASKYPKTVRAPRARLDAARLVEDEGDLNQARRRYEELIFAYPDAPSSERALDSLVQVWQAMGKDGAEIRAKLDRISLKAPALRELSLFRQATITESIDTKGAIALYEQLSIAYPLPSGRYSDEGLLRAAELRLELGDARGADIVLKSLGDAHAESLLVGSYNRTAYSQAAFLRARIHHELFADNPEAIRLFREVWHNFPTSILVDDAVFLVAKLVLESGNPTEACRTLAELKRLAPESRYLRCEPFYCAAQAEAPAVCLRSLPPLGRAPAAAAATPAP